MLLLRLLRYNGKRVPTVSTVQVPRAAFTITGFFPAESILIGGQCSADEKRSMGHGSC
jgi:hypothetical protein